MNVLVIHNLISGAGDDSIFDFVRKYAVDGDSVTIRTFGGSTPFPELLEGAEAFDFVVACGGDGTVSTVLHELRYTGIPVLPFPAGTANLLALNLNSPTEPEAMVKMVDAGHTLDIDLGILETREDSYGFSIMAGCGYDQKIMFDAAPNKQFMGQAAYFHAAFNNPLPQCSEIVLTIDGQEVHTQGIGVVFVNLDRMQFDLTISEENSPVDGMMDVAVLKTNTALELIPTVAAKMMDPSGELAKKVGGIEIYRGREIKVEAEPALMMEYDGEPTEIPTPFTVHCLPGAARIIVTEETLRSFAGR